MTAWRHPWSGLRDPPVPSAGVHLTLAGRVYDVTNRPLVVGALEGHGAPSPDDIRRLLDDGADIVEEAGLHLSDGVILAADLKEAAGMVKAGKPVMVTANDLATMAVAVTIGCRLIRTTAGHVRAARRVCDVVAAILAARA